MDIDTLNLGDEPKTNVNVKMPQSVRDKVKSIVQERNLNRPKGKKRITESDVYRAIVIKFFS